jgi:alanyl-tRNA synthetase
MKNLELRKIIKEFADEKGYPTITPAKIFNKASENTFNFSIEEAILRKYDSYFNIFENYIYQIIQPCIRMGDFGRIKQKKSTNFHSSLFDMTGYYEFDTSEKSLLKLQEKTINDLWDLFVNILKLDKTKLKVSYFSGGKISSLTKEKVANDFEIPEDSLTKELFLKLGLNEKQLEPCFDQDTVLLTFPLPEDFYVGHRPEIFYKGPRGDYFEIGTMEFIRWKRTTSKSGISIEPLGASISLFVFGIERMLAAINNFNDSFEVDSIQPLVLEIRKIAENKDEISIRKFADALRTFHAIISDGGSYETLNRDLKEDLRLFLKAISDGLDKLSISENNLSKFFTINAELNPWKKELLNSIDSAVTEFTKYKQRQG